MKSVMIVLLTFLISLTAQAEIKIEPVYGVERTQRLYPEPAKFVTRSFVGIRALMGSTLLSGEFETNQSIQQDEFPDQDLKVNYIIQRAYLGVRSYPVHGKYFGMFFRGGIRGRKEKREITEAGVSRTDEGDIVTDPYAGAGLTITFGNNFALNAGATLVYNKNAESESEKYDTQYSFSFSIKAGSNNP